MECTLITYEDGKKAILYERDPVALAYQVSEISYPDLTTEEIQEIKEATWDNVQIILSKY